MTRRKKQRKKQPKKQAQMTEAQKQQYADRAFRAMVTTIFDGITKAVENRAKKSEPPKPQPQEEKELSEFELQQRRIPIWATY